MKPDEFEKLREERAKNNWEEALAIWEKHKPALSDKTNEIGFMFQWCMRDIASIQIMIEKLVEHTKMPKLDAD